MVGAIERQSGQRLTAILADNGGWGSRGSISNYMFNHIVHFASADEALCKAMFFGGVTRRFPQLRCAFLECGVGWAASLYADLIGHWQKA